MVERVLQNHIGDLDRDTNSNSIHKGRDIGSIPVSAITYLLDEWPDSSVGRALNAESF